MTIETNKLKTEKEWFSCRDILWYLTFCGFALNYMLRINLSITIVAMVQPRPVAVAVAQCDILKDVQLSSNLSNLSSNVSSAIKITEYNITNTSTTKSLEPGNTASVNPDPDRFSWNEYEQGLALGGYYWLHWLLQIPGGLLARRYGTKLIFGLSNLITALLGFLLPFAARQHLYFFVFIRVIQGLVEAPSWPAMHDMTAKWIPSTERSKFISAYLGSSVGAALTYPLCVMLINWLGWDSVFYITSALGVIWYVAWYYLAYDTPQEHPRISEVEKNYILENLGDDVDHVNTRPVPWKAILTSTPVWLTAIAQTGGSWGVLTLMAEAPSYFNYIHGWNIGAAGVLSAAPHVGRMLFSYAFSSLVDWILRSKKMTISNLRKLAVFVCNGVQGFLLLGLAFSGCHPNSAIIFMISGVAVSGSLSAGTLASCVDLSPNYASIILGMSNMLAVTAGFVAPMIVGILTNNNQTIEQWRLVFLITVAIIIVTGLLYICFGTSNLQPWNDIIDNEEEGAEFQRLKPKIRIIQPNETSETIAKPEYGTSTVNNVQNHVGEVNL